MQNIPQIGFGTWQAPLDVTKKSVISALEAGYTHIDCAYAYENEKAVGEALGFWFQSHLRSSVWVTSKLWNTNHKPENVKKQLQQTLKDLQLEYLDLFIIHWPVQFEHGTELFPKNQDGSLRIERGYGLYDTWKALEQCVKEGLCKNIGVSNYTVALMQDLLQYAEIKPLCNQVEVHPFFQNDVLINFCHQRGVTVTAYSPLGGSYGGVSELAELSKDPKVEAIAKRVGKSVAQVILKWHIQKFPKQYCIIPKSVTPDRIKENLAIVGFSLEKTEMDYINSLNRKQRQCDSNIFWKIPLFI